MVSTDPAAAQLTLSGRALALQRRQAMAQHGKAATGSVMARAGVHTSQTAGVARPAGTAAGPGAEAARYPSSPVALAAAVSPARLRRQALSQSGKASEWGSSAQRTRDAGSALRGGASTARSGSEATRPAGVQAAAACNCAGGCAGAPSPSSSLVRPAGLESAAASGEQIMRAAWQAVHSNNGRRAALTRRQALSEKGAGGRPEAASCRPSGRLRPARVEVAPPPKVAQGHTLSGRSVTGTLVDPTRKFTGTEPGQCRTVTGTEYLGLEPFESLCGTRPAPGPAKVGESRTLREQRVTGTELGQSPRHTGDEHGACKPVTGTEYLGLEQYTGACGTRPPEARPHKVSVMSTPSGQTVSGAPMERSSKVTGDERGALRSLTGTGFQSPAKPEVDAPPKVGSTVTRGGQSVTGTEVGPLSRVTGDDRGSCRAVTGTDYIGVHQQQGVCAAPQAVAPVAKVGLDTTWQGQSVSGTQLGRSGRVTGNEPGSCAPISGTPYVGARSFGSVCSTEQQAQQRAALPQRLTIPAATVSGDRLGSGGSALTGDERGACLPVSGTRYIGRDNSPASCPPVVPRWLPRTNAPAVELPSAPAAFSIVPPAQQMQQRMLESGAERSVTGSGMGTQRITGPVNKGSGMVTGTPEFRHVPPTGSPLPAREAEPSAAGRLTGEGSQAGTRVSGDAWQGQGRVTGTEGMSSLARNPSQRGQPRGMGMGMGAMRWREEIERPEVPPSPITGSSGNSLKGAAITVSGGARA